MDSVTLKNFRCFRKEQTARLAPLTLLVGENSTGKTSFMAMIRALGTSPTLMMRRASRKIPTTLGALTRSPITGEAGEGGLISSRRGSMPYRT